MPRQIVVFALAVILVACAKEAEKPVDNADSAVTPAAGYSSSPQSASGSETATETLSQEDSLRLRNREILDSIHGELYNFVYPVDTIPDKTGIGGKGTIITWWPDNIHLVKRKNDTLVLATFERDYEMDVHASPAYMDLVAASLKNGKFRIIDRKNNISLGEWGKLPAVGDFRINQSAEAPMYGEPVGTGFRRFGRNTWGWILSSPWSGQGFSLNSNTIYALIGSKIQHLGVYQAADDNSGAYDGGSGSVFHSYYSTAYPLDDQHPSVSDLAIIWYHNFSRLDSNQRITIHRYRPGKGYDFSSLPYSRCTHDTNYRMVEM